MALVRGRLGWPQPGTEERVALTVQLSPTDLAMLEYMAECGERSVGEQVLVSLRCAIGQWVDDTISGGTAGDADTTRAVGMAEYQVGEVLPDA